MFPEKLRGVSLRYRLRNHAGSAVSEHDVINVMQVCFDVNVNVCFYVLLVRVRQKNSDKMCVFSFLMCI